MVATKTRKPKKSKPAARTLEDAKAAQQKAKDSAAFVASLSPKERKKLYADFDKCAIEIAPTTAAAGSDLLKALQAVGGEFIARYYPDATQANLYVARYGKNFPEYSVHIPVPVSVRGQTSPPMPTATPTDPAAVRLAFIAWWKTTEHMVDNVLRPALRTPGHPLYEALDESERAAALAGLDGCTDPMTNGCPLPPPATAEQLALLEK